MLFIFTSFLWGKNLPPQHWNVDIKNLYCNASPPKIFVCHLKFQKKIL